ncbi:MAG: Enoyl-CoA hydratase/isomerase [Amnibacterium sp.]|nr:Enoyl-CoA hydratase/isomerase [Amnibacterium sp.]
MKLHDGVAWITLSNPGKRNSFTWRMYDQLAAIADDLAGRDDLSAVVFRGDPEDGFAAGTDIRQFSSFTSAEDGVQYERRVAAVVQKLLGIPVPTIALVEGAAVGAGLVVVLCCDIVVAERGARFGAPIARTLGNCLPAAVIARLRSRVGVNMAAGMLLAAALVPAEALTAVGFVFELVEPGGLPDAAENLLRRIRMSAPLSVRSLKQLLRRVEDSAPAVPDEDLLALCYGSGDFHEGVLAFLADRRPHWTGR